MAQVELKDAHKQYGKSDASVVSELNLTVNEGEFVVLLGPSGCGKTTTLRMIAGLETLTSGELWFDDQLVNSVPPDRRDVGMVFQNYALYPHMTVEQNLSFGLRAARTPKAEVRQRVVEIAGLLGLEAYLGRRPKALSGGQRQRVALGRALMRRPSVFLMDEPLSNLDANLREQMRIELARLHAQLGITTVYVTHDQGEALTLADRVVIMEGGRIRQCGAPAEVYGQPADTFVAGFIGSPGMNLWTSNWYDDGQSVWLGERALRLPRTFLSVLDEMGPTVTVGVRPEHLGVSRAADDVEVNCFVEMLEQLGSHAQLHAEVKLAGHATGRLVARLGVDVDVRRGEKLVLSAPPEAIHFFEAASGRRVDAGQRSSVGSLVP